MLNKQRRVRPLVGKAVKPGERVVSERFGVDEDICTGDHACIRLSGCPSLSVKHTDDPLRDDPVAAIDNDLRRLRQLRRGGRGGGALPLVLSRRDRPQPDALGPPARRLRGAVIGWLAARRSRGRDRFA